MTDSHKIGKIIYNTRFDTEELAFEFQSNVSAFLQNELAPVIGDVCDQLELKDTHIFINSLELNLGNFSYDRYEDEIKEKLKKELYQALKEKIGKLDKEPSANGHIITKKKSAFRHLIHFLQHGSLGWNAEIHDRNYIIKTFETTLDNYPAPLIQWLKIHGKQEPIRKRIVYQFDTAHINKIIEKADPVNAPFINAYSTDLIQTHKIKPSLSLSEKDFSNLTWEAILAYILTNNSSRFNRKSFVKYTLEKIAARNNMAYGELIKAFAGSIPRLLKNQALKTEFPDLIIELKNEFSDPKETRTRQAITNNKEKIKWLNELLDILKGETKLTDPKIIENLAAKYPTDFIKLLQQAIATKTYNTKNLPEILKEIQQLDLNGHFVGPFAGSIKKLLKNKALKDEFRELVIELKNEFSDPKEIKGQQAENNKEKAKWLKELLAILKGEAGLTDPKIIENLAAKYPADFIKLLQQAIATKTYNTKNLPEILKEIQQLDLNGHFVGPFAGSIKKLLKNKALKDEFRELVIELKNEFSDPKEIKGQQAENNKEKAKWLKELLAILKGGAGINDFKVIENLSAKYPAALIKLLEQVITTKTYAKKLPEILKGPQLIALVRILEPGEKDFINYFTGCLDNLNNTQANETISPLFSEKKWAIILNYILKEYGHFFNRTDFVRQTLKGLANKNENTYKKAVRVLFSMLKAHTENNIHHQVLLSAIKMLHEDIILDTQKRVQPDYEILQLFYPYELFDALIFYLDNGYTYRNMFSMHTYGEMSKVLSEMERISPVLTSKFTAYLLDGKNIDLLLKNTDVNFIEATAFVLMKTFYSSSYYELARLKEIIKTKPKDTNDDIFWGQLIKRFVKNKGENTNIVLDEMEKNFSSVIIKKTLLPISSMAIKTDIFQQLANNQNTGKTGLSYEECWYYLLESHPSHTKHTLLYIAGQPAMLEKLIRNTNNKLLFRLLSQLSPSANIKNFIRHFTQSFGITGQPGSDPATRLIWKTAFETLAFTEQRNETDLIKTLLYKTFTEIKDNSFKERAFNRLKKNIETIPGKEKNETIQVLEEIKNEITSQHNRKIADSDVNMGLKTEALAFLKGEPAKTFSRYQLFDYLLWYFKEDPGEASEKLTELLNFTKTRQFWISSFPGNLLLRIIFLIYPRHIVSIRNSADIIWNAVTSVMKQNGAKPKCGYWHYLIEALYACNHKKQVENFCRLFIGQILDEISLHKKEAFLNHVITELNNAATPVKKEIFINIIQEIKKIAGITTRIKKEEQPDGEKGIKEKQPPKEHKQSTYEEIKEDPGEPLYISNAGLVLAAPSLSPLFVLFKLVEKNQFIHKEAAGRAAHLLQYMVDESTAAPEFLLTLNKVLCGIDPEDPIPLEIEITDYEKACIEQLLKDMIYHWKEMRNTSINSFRLSFLQREGSLYRKDEWWELHVEPKPFDMLIDQIPWTYSTIRYSWMQMPLYVKWRE